MTEFEGDILFESIEIAVDCRVVPACWDDEFHACIYEIVGWECVIELIVEAIDFLIIVFAVVEQFWVGEFAGIWEYSDIFFVPGEDEKGHGDVVDEHGLYEFVEVHFVFGLEDWFHFQVVVLGVCAPFEFLVQEVLALHYFVGLEDKDLSSCVLDTIVDLGEDLEKFAVGSSIFLCQIFQWIQ